MNFSEALNWIKKGERLSRQSWRVSLGHTPTRFVYLVQGSEFTVNRPPLNEIFPAGTVVRYCPHIDIRNADGSCGVWTPTQSDILADDWQRLI